MRALLVMVLVACGTTPPTAATSTHAPPATAPRKTGAPTSLTIGYVLLSSSTLPDAAAIVRAHQEIAPNGPALDASTGVPPKDGILTFEQGGSTVSVALMPVAVPGGEAEAYAAFSMKALAEPWKVPPHRAHLIVANLGAGGTAVERTRNAHRVIAATVAASGSNAVGVYIGGSVTHEPGFYVDAIRTVEDPTFAWFGVSVAREGDRLSLLSRGMEQVGLPDTLLTAGTTPSGDALEYLFDLLLYVATRGDRLPEGDTVGRTADERIPVTYVRSPIDDARQVLRVDLP